VRALLAAITCEKGDLQANLAAHIDLLRGAAHAGCDLVVFPEFSLTGSIDPARRPDDAIAVDHDAIKALVAATAEYGPAAVFGLSERRGDEYFITQAVASEGRLVGIQRKRHLGEDEQPYSTGSETLVFELRSQHLGIIICAEGNVDWTWDATTRAGAEIVLFCSAPGLYGRRTDEASWRAGFEWWDAHGVGNAIRQAKRLNVPVAMATQAGTTVDEDFPGIAALVSAVGGVIDRLPDWRSGTLVVDL
jgi:predicted amidohydrolase